MSSNASATARSSCGYLPAITSAGLLITSISGATPSPSTAHSPLASTKPPRDATMRPPSMEGSASQVLPVSGGLEEIINVFRGFYLASCSSTSSTIKVRKPPSIIEHPPSTSAKIASPPNNSSVMKPRMAPATICGITIKKLNTPMK